MAQILIKERLDKLKQSLPPNITKNYYLGSKKSPLTISLPESVNLLLNTSKFWVEVEGDEYTPSYLVKSLFERKDGQDINQKLFTVFIADLKRTLAESNGIAPKSVWNKQKNSFWDKDFVIALFTHCTLCLNSPRKNVSKFAYYIREDITLGELTEIYFYANSLLVPD